MSFTLVTGKFPLYIDKNPNSLLTIKHAVVSGE